MHALHVTVDSCSDAHKDMALVLHTLLQTRAGCSMSCIAAHKKTSAMHQARHSVSKTEEGRRAGKGMRSWG